MTTFFQFKEIIYFLILASVLTIAGSIYLAYIFRRTKKYKKYLSEDGIMTGREAATRIMQMAGYNAGFTVYKPGKVILDPFYGNVFLPDEKIFIMRREILDGKTLLSFCVGCQLATNAVEYLGGNIRLKNACDFEGRFGIRYILNETEIENVASSVKISR